MALGAESQISYSSEHAMAGCVGAPIQDIAEWPDDDVGVRDGDLCRRLMPYVRYRGIRDRAADCGWNGSRERRCRGDSRNRSIRNKKLGFGKPLDLRFQKDE